MILKIKLKPPDTLNRTILCVQHKKPLWNNESSNEISYIYHTMPDKMESNFSENADQKADVNEYSCETMNVTLKTDSVSATIVDINHDFIRIGIRAK